MQVDENVELKWENMRVGIDAQVSLVKDVRVLYAKVAERLAAIPLPTRIYLTGCGDSHYCGLAARHAFETWTGLSTEPLEALEFCRYVVENAPATSLVVSVSNSGKVARTTESNVVARLKGMTAVGVTYNPEGRLAKNSDVVIQYTYPEIGFGPGTVSYMASLLSLYCIAINVGQRLGRLSAPQVDGILTSIEQLATPMEETIAQQDGVLSKLGREMPVGARLTFVGGGPNYGTSLFGMAKFIEAAQLYCVGQELEEWAHEQFFCTEPGTYTMVLAPAGRSVDRAREQLQAVRDVGGLAIAVCQADDHETAALADVVVPVVGNVDEILSPILYCIAPELLAYHYASTKDFVMLGFNDANRQAVNFRQIFGSKIPGEF